MPVTCTGPISAVERTWVPPQGCRSRPAISISRTDAGALRRLDRHGLDQSGIGLEFGIADPAAGDGGVARDHLIELGGDGLLVEAGVGNIEIEPAIAVADRAAGHRVGQHGGQQMQRRVHAHAGVTLFPIDGRGDGVAGFERRGVGAFGRHVRDLAFGLVGIDRGGDGDGHAGRGPQPAGVAGLAARGGVEHRAVEHDAAFVREGDDARLAGLQITVVAEQAVGGHRASTLHERRFDLGLAASSHSGTGSFFARRNSGLNSLDW